MGYEDLKEHGSESAVKAAGKLRQQGKPYESESFMNVQTCVFTTLLQCSMAISRTGNRVHEYCNTGVLVQYSIVYLQPTK